MWTPYQGVLCDVSIKPFELSEWYEFAKRYGNYTKHKQKNPFTAASPDCSEQKRMPPCWIEQQTFSLFFPSWRGLEIQVKCSTTELKGLVQIKHIVKHIQNPLFHWNLQTSAVCNWPVAQ